jgi:hypothetical protein
MFAKLEQYRLEHGNWLVPNDYKEHPSLGRWVSKQRTRCEELVPTRRERLESIGFVWNPLDQPWEDMCAKLEQYCRQHGDCFVTKNYKEDPSLGRWVSKQRSGRDELDSTRQTRLESIGFVWDADDQQWEEMFARLKEYRR